MSLLKIKSLKVICRSKEDEAAFLRRLNLILSLYEIDGGKASYEYSIEESNQITPLETGMYRDPVQY